MRILDEQSLYFLIAIMAFLSLFLLGACKSESLRTSSQAPDTEKEDTSEVDKPAREREESAEREAETETESDEVFGRYTFLHEISFYDSETGEWETIEVSNCFSLQFISEDQVALAGTMTFANGHSCQVYGEASRESPTSFRQLIDDDFYPEPCDLEILFEDEKLRLVDEGGRCQRINCGARGYLDGLTFPRSSREPDETCELSEDTEGE